MLGFHHLRRKLLIVLVMAALCPMAGRQLVMLMVHAQRFYLNAEGSVSRSVRRSFGQTFLHQMNCQLLESVPKHSKPKSKVSAINSISKTVFFSRLTAKTAPAVLGENVYSSAGFIPLRI